MIELVASPLLNVELELPHFNPKTTGTCENMIDSIIEFIKFVAIIATPSFIAWQIYKKMIDALPEVEISISPYPNVGNDVYLARIKLHPAKKSVVFSKISVKDAMVSNVNGRYEGNQLIFSPSTEFLPGSTPAIISVPSSFSSKKSVSWQLFIKPSSLRMWARISLHVESAFPWARVSKKVLISKHTD